MKHWVLHFDDGKGQNKCSREYPQPFFPKWKDVVNMMDREKAKGNPFFTNNFFTGMCVLVDLEKKKRELADVIGRLIYN